MSLSLYQITIPTYLQILGATAGLLDKAEKHCRESDLPAGALTQARLAEDMKPFAYQITSVAHHSQGAIEGVQQGVFAPGASEPPEDFENLHHCLARAREYLEGVSEEAINALVGRPMRFEMGNYRLDFTVENFLMSFSQPNFYFHATTAYDILRHKGLPIGKADFMGGMRTR